MEESLVAALTVFVLASVVGFELISKVPPTLHTPLMSGANAISGISIVGALVATGGGLLFGGDTHGRFKAFDMNTGKVLWTVNLGSPVTGFPIAYAVDGRQFIAVSTGSSATTTSFLSMTPEVRPSFGNQLFVFALPERR